MTYTIKNNSSISCTNSINTTNNNIYTISWSTPLTTFTIKLV